MRKVLGIVAEYNPFHNGHLYHLSESKEQKGADYSVCVMSGNFSQRGDAALLDKWSRTEMALRSGVDLVIELPLVYSISSAENFAYGSMNVLDKLGIVNYISFGSEVGDLSILDSIADILCNEPKEYVSLLNHELSKGISYPKAREKALLMYLNDIRKYANVLSGSNNILGIEYLKALRKLKSNITPITIKREKNEYNSTKINKGFASSTAIRKNINKLSAISKVVPEESFAIIQEKVKRGQIVNGLSAFEKEIIYKLRTMSLQEISDLPDVSEGLENAIKKASDSCNNVMDLITFVKSKRYTQTRIQRILLYALLGITKQDMANSLKGIPYVRVLGMTENGKRLLSDVVSSRKLDVITSPKKYLENTNSRIAKNLFLKDINATNIYTLGYEYDSKSNLDFTTPVVTI